MSIVSTTMDAFSLQLQMSEQESVLVGCALSILHRLAFVQTLCHLSQMGGTIIATYPE